MKRYVSYNSFDDQSEKIPMLTAKQACEMAPTREDFIQEVLSKINMDIIRAAQEGKTFTRIYPHDFEHIAHLDGAVLDVRLRLSEKGFYLNSEPGDGLPTYVSWGFPEHPTEEEIAQMEGLAPALENVEKMIKRNTPTKEQVLDIVSRNVAEQISQAMWRGETWLLVEEDDMKFLTTHAAVRDFITLLKSFDFRIEYKDIDDGYISGRKLNYGSMKVMFF